MTLDNLPGGPISLSDALNYADSQIDNLAKDAEDGEAPQEAEEADEAPEGETLESAEEDADEQPEVEEPEQEEDGPQILTTDEYGDVLVDVNGEQTSLSDLVQGTLRQADYTRKTQELSQQRKEWEAKIKEKEAELAEREQQLSQQDDPEPDWVKLAEEDPLGWASEKARWDAKQRERAERQKQATARKQEQLQNFVNETMTKAVEVVPEWSDPKKFNEGVDARKAVALEAGFTAEEYSSTPDFRIAVLLQWAAEGKRLKAEQGQKRDLANKKIAKAPKVLKPGQSQGDRDPKSERRAAFQKRLSKPVSSDTIRGMLGR